MLPIIAIILVILAGNGLVSLLPLKLAWSERLALASVFGVSLAAVAGFLLAWLTNYQTGMLLSGVVLVVVAVLPLLFESKVAMRPEPLPRNRYLASLYLGLWVALGAYTFIFVQTHFLQVLVDGGWYSAGYTWSDLTMHLSLSSYFATQDRVNFVMPIFASGAMNYPFLANFFSAELFRIGGSWQLAFGLPTFVLLLSVLRLSLGLVARLTKRMQTAWIHLTLILGSGSVAGLGYFWQNVQQHGWRLAWPMEDYSNLGEGPALHFANFVTSHLLPQRSYLFGFALFLGLGYLLYTVLEKPSKRVAIAIGVGIGFLPFIHTHTTFVALGLLLIIIILQMIRRQPTAMLWITFAIALALAVPQVAWQFKASYSSGFTQFKPGWMTPDDQSFLLFWLRNIGLGLIAIPAGLLFLWKKKLPVLLIGIVWMGVGLAILGNLFIFQPNVWDNMKFFTYAYCFLMIPVAMFLSQGLRRWHTVIPVVLVVLSMTVCGYLTIARDLKLVYQVVSKEDLRLVDALQSKIPKTAIIATSDRNNNPIPLLLGRAVAVGYPGWLWSYGINYFPHMNALDNFWRGSLNGAEANRQLGITYAVVARNEMYQLGFNQTYFDSHYPIIYADGMWVAYQIVK